MSRRSSRSRSSACRREARRRAALSFLAGGWNEGFPAFTNESLARRRLGRICEEPGRTEDAVDAYDYVVALWKDTEPEGRPMVEEARAPIAELRARAPQ